MAQNIIYWKFDNNTLYIRGENLSGYTLWYFSNAVSSASEVPWDSNRSSIYSVIIETTINVEWMNYWFYECSNLVSITNFNYIHVVSLYNCFYGCTSFNQPITIPSSVTDMSYCFRECTSFNQPITIPSSVTNMSNCFRSCNSFDKSIIISNSVTDMSYCFYYCTSFNKPITIPSSVTNMTYCFAYSSNFNSQVTFEIPSSVTDMRYCFYSCISFNKPITIPSSVTNMSNCFRSCTILNNNVVCFNYPTSYSNIFSATAKQITVTLIGDTACDHYSDWATILNSYSNVGFGPPTFDVQFELGDYRYKYMYSSGDISFNIKVIDKTKTTYSAINSTVKVNNEYRYVTSMSSCFQDCTSFNQAITIPSSVTDMYSCFQGCTSFNQAITIPNSVTYMGYCFYGCTSFNKSITIPSSITDIRYCFRNCTSLTGAIRINSNPGSYTDMFKDTVKEIVLLGSSTLLNSFATTANNHNVYVWTLTAQPTANRDNNVGTSANLSVKVQSYAISNSNIIRAIKVYEDDSINPLNNLTWDKQFTIDENPKTFTTTITGIDENTTVTYRIQVEDNYGVSSFREVIVPTNYYTIDFLSGGKEISFGEKAAESDLNKYKLLYTEPSDWDSNWTNYYQITNDEYVPVTGDSAPTFTTNTYYRKIESLFKCKMETAFDDMDSNEFADFMSDLDISGSELETTQADWIVEQGVDGIWTWRKWQSGIAECWGDTGEITLTNYTTIGTFLYGYNTSVQFPTNLFVSKPIVTYSAYVGNGFALTGTETQSITTSAVSLYALCTATGSKTTIWQVSAKGRWK